MPLDPLAASGLLWDFMMTTETWRAVDRPFTALFELIFGDIQQYKMCDQAHRIHWIIGANNENTDDHVNGWRLRSLWEKLGAIEAEHRQMLLDFSAEAEYTIRSVMVTHSNLVMVTDSWVNTLIIFPSFSIIEHVYKIC